MCIESLFLWSTLYHMPWSLFSTARFGGLSMSVSTRAHLNLDIGNEKAIQAHFPENSSVWPCGDSWLQVQTFFPQHLEISVFPAVTVRCLFVAPVIITCTGLNVFVCVLFQSWKQRSTNWVCGEIPSPDSVFTRTHAHRQGANTFYHQLLLNYLHSNIATKSVTVCVEDRKTARKNKWQF